jgi:hypothetical protein
MPLYTSYNPFATKKSLLSTQEFQTVYARDAVCETENRKARSNKRQLQKISSCSKDLLRKLDN